MKGICGKMLVGGLCILVLLLLTSCRSSKRNQISQQQTAWDKQENDIAISQGQELIAEIEKVVSKAVEEQINMRQKETEYDTEKPIDKETGKPPVKKEKEIFFEKQRVEVSEAAEATAMSQHNLMKTEDYSIQEHKSDNITEAQSEVNMQKESDIFLKWVGGIFITLAILCLILYMLYRYLKKKRHNLL